MESDSKITLDPETYYKAKIGVLEEALADANERAARYAAALAQFRAEMERKERLDSEAVPAE